MGETLMSSYVKISFKMFFFLHFFTFHSDMSVHWCPSVPIFKEREWSQISIKILPNAALNHKEKILNFVKLLWFVELMFFHVKNIF